METTKNIVLPQNFSQSSWIDFFETNSQVYVEAVNKKSNLQDLDFAEIISIGYLDCENSGKCGIYIIKSTKSLTERAGRKRQFDKAIDIIKKEQIQSGLFVFYDDACAFRFSLIYPVYKGTKRTFSNYHRHSFYVHQDLSNKTYILQLNKYQFDSMADLKDAFSVEKVSDLFYQEFEKEYAKLKAGITKSFDASIAEDERGNIALLFVIRIIFLGFVQKKGWLGDKPSFIQNYTKVGAESKTANGIYRDFLEPLFFHALNMAPTAKNKYHFPNVPEPFQSALVRAPYLNGGLFRKHKDCDDCSAFITDEAITGFINFLFSFNFTLEENTLYDEELELNPEFLGIIFEKLINKEHGAIYTPRLEVDFMCRLSLVKYLQQNCLSSISLENLYKLFFPEYGDENEQTAGDFTEEEAKDLLDKLETVTVCDPAIGSGAFAVGMLNVIDEVECSIYSHFLPDIPISSAYERKKRIIFQSLYGVEVKQWAVWITQLRLWITLLIEAEDSLKHSDEPLLPSFDFKIRQGDSLIQMLGDGLFPVSGEGMISGDSRAKIKDLMKLKTEYYYNKCPQKLHDIELKHRNLYIAIMEKKKKDLLQKLSRMRGEETREVQVILFETNIQSEIDFASKQQKREIDELESMIHEVDEEISQITKKNLPFIWRIDFPEIFIEKGGFDIVIGNPPYVPLRKIENPDGVQGKTDNYRTQLKLMACQDFPDDLHPIQINGGSDLYLFFYIRGIKLLNNRGNLTYICSSSWLDVEFGAWLQKFLLERCQVYFIIDNLSNRSFQHAGINTIISIVGAWQSVASANDLIRFAAFKIPYENSLYTENLLTIEETPLRIDYGDLRVNPVSRMQLSQEGRENSTEKKYQGSKWGGIYIKAPDIYFTVIEKARDKLVKLGDIADVTRGFTTGADEFFYIPKSNPHQIEKEFLKPVIKSPRECKSILINPSELGLWLFICPHEKHELKGTNALKYIEMGETAQKYIKQGKDKGKYITGIQNVSSIQGRKKWYDLGLRDIPDLFIPSGFDETFKVYQNNGILCNQKLYEVRCKSNIYRTLLILNSTLFYFFIEVHARTSLGDGLLNKTVSEIESTNIIDPKYIAEANDIDARLNAIKHRDIHSIFQELQVSPDAASFDHATPLPDRKALDEIVFKALGLTEPEIKALYAGLLELTANRLRKARTFS